MLVPAVPKEGVMARAPETAILHDTWVEPKPNPHYVPPKRVRKVIIGRLPTEEERLERYARDREKRMERLRRECEADRHLSLNSWLIKQRLERLAWEEWRKPDIAYWPND
jgi:hypothetical protein